jgi:hypothetical protein
MWLLIDSSMKQATVHSAHLDRTVAEQWRACLEHDGKDISIVYFDKGLAAEILDKLEGTK